MASATATQTRAPIPRGRGTYRGRRGARGGYKPANGLTRDPDPISSPNITPTTSALQAQSLQNQEPGNAIQHANSSAAVSQDDTPLCWICAEPVKYWSLSECNHRTCHVCALRLRALYKKLDCTFCKEPQPSVIFTTSPDTPWPSYTPDNIPYKDPKLAISFETQEMMEETLILLRFNCPDDQCSFIANGWSDLKLHTRATHGKLMCDLCIRFKKVFAHEHALYEPNVLPIHLPSMGRGHKREHTKQQVEGGVHPLCEFCRECSFGDDELYAHMREKHEECFICKRNEVKDQYFRNYEALEEHFMHTHFPCRRAECLARKFVVFGSALDLKAHMVEDHGADMSARDKRDARRVQAEFEFDEVGGGHGRRGRRDRGDRERERNPPAAQPPPPPPPGPAARPQTAATRRREAFGGTLTATPDGGGGSSGASQQPSRGQSPSPESGENDPRLGALTARLVGLTLNPPFALSAIKVAIHSYRVSESAARDVISTVWNILDRNLDGTASIVNAIVDVLEDEGKKRELLAAWNGFKVEQRNQFPELVPTAVGSEWAGVTSGRVLNAKHSTATRSSSQSSRQLWDRVARAAASTSTATPAAAPSSSAASGTRPTHAFPPLAGSGPTPNTTSFRQPQRLTPWAAASAATVTPAPPPVPANRAASVPGPGANSKARPAVLSSAEFPGLPTDNARRVPKSAVGGNKSLRNMRESGPAESAWHSGSKHPGPAHAGGGGDSDVHGGGVEQVEEGAAGTVGKKKGKGKQKQTLFTLGSFPT